MTKYIDKSALIAEINKMVNEYPCDNSEQNIGYNCAICDVQNFLDALETKEADLEKALSDLDKDIKEFVTTEEFEKDSAVYGHYWAIAKYFFELGLFSTLTWQDIRLIAEIGNDFMNSEESDNIELTDEAYYGAILNKVMEKVREEGRDTKTSWSENRKARGE